MQNRRDQISFDRFIDAARAGDVRTIEEYISQHRQRGDLVTAVNAADQYGDTALICAATYGHTAAVQALLAIPGINVNAADQYGDTALICAAANGHTAAVQALLAATGINVNAVDHFDDTALTRAAANGHTAIVQALLAVPGINAADQLGNTALICAAYRGHTTTVQALLADPGINVEAQDNYHRTAAAVAERRINDGPAHREIYNLIIAAIRARRASSAAAASNMAVTVEKNKSNDEVMPNAETLRTARLKMFDRTLPASNPALSPASQPAGQNDEVVIDRQP